MIGKQHLFTGIMVGTTLSLLYPTIGGSIIIGTSIGGILPDIDTPNSMISKIFTIANKIINLFTPHRGITHDIGIFGVITTIFYLFYHQLFFTSFLWTVLPGVFLGILSHLVLDGFTRQGVPIFFSYRKGKYFHLLPSFLRCKSSSIGAWLYTITINIAISLPIMTHFIK